MKYEAGDEGGDVGMGSDERVFVYYAKKFRLLDEESSSRPKSLCHFSGLTIGNYKALPGRLHGVKVPCPPRTWMQFSRENRGEGLRTLPLPSPLGRACWYVCLHF